MIYIGTGTDKQIYAIYPNGTLKWNFSANENIYTVPAVASDGTVYFVSSSGNLFAVNPDGTLKWKFVSGESNYHMSSPAIVSDGMIYVGSTDGHLYAINPDGTEKWNVTQ